MENNQGFIKLSRKYFDNFLWKEPRVYSKAEAWLDLIGSARFEASTEIVNSRVIEVQRGEIPASRRFLEERWKWGSTKVANFIETLTKKGMINQRQEQGQTILMLCKYNSYNDVQTSDKPPIKPMTSQRQTSGEPAANQRQTKDKEYKKERTKEDINIPLYPPEGNPLIGSEDITHEVLPKEKSSAKKEKEPNYSFEAFWELYDKKVGKKDILIKKWLKISDEERELAMSYIPKYKLAQPDKKYRKNPETFLNQKAWNDELIFENGNRQLPATNQIGTRKPYVNSSGNDAANKRAELDGLKYLAGAVLRGTKPQND